MPFPEQADGPARTEGAPVQLKNPSGYVRTNSDADGSGYAIGVSATAARVSRSVLVCLSAVLPAEVAAELVDRLAATFRVRAFRCDGHDASLPVRRSLPIPVRRKPRCEASLHVEPG
jgi:hypothetical protein